MAPPSSRVNLGKACKIFSATTSQINLSLTSPLVTYLFNYVQELLSLPTMISTTIPRLLSRAPQAILLRQQAHRLHQNGMSPTCRFQQTQRNYSPRRKIHRDEKRNEQSSGWSDRFNSHFRRHESKSRRILGKAIQLTGASEIYRHICGLSDIC